MSETEFPDNEGDKLAERAIEGFIARLFVL
jgi:hypothetical protein